MKKLMIATAAAALVGGAFAIESANIVGYANNSLCNGNSYFAPQFAAIGDEDGKVNLQDIGCNNLDGGVALSFLNEYGMSVDTFTFISWAGENGDELAWVCTGGDRADAGDEVNYPKDVFIYPGQGVLVEAYTEDDVVLSSGEVSTKETQVYLTNGNTFSGNNTPTPINLQDIECSNLDGGVALSTLNEYGMSVDTFTFISWAGESGEELAWTCTGGDRADAGDEVNYPKDVFILPGQGILIEAYSSDDYVILPGTELD